MLRKSILRNFTVNLKEVNLKTVSLKSFSALMLCITLLTSISYVQAAPLLQRGVNDQGTNVPQNKSEAQGEVVETESALLNYRMFKQMETMQQEIQNLRGILEEQNYQIERLKKAERERYADLDRRMTVLSQQKNNTSNLGASTQSQAVSLPMDEDEKTYTSAKSKVDSKEYNAAIAEFTLYLEFFPNGKYVAQAHYWMGELYLALEFPEYENAMSHFETVVKDYPAHAKVPGSLYKMGLIQIEQAKKADAKKTFQKLVKEFPSNASSSLAKKQLEKL